ncbi:unnamed protein product [Fraxinus pennsylvanica]|uniref:Uncharacterized protein n=1 Tax=Fraxinus pennsylvanica TaxID=56036 RepID=A0AAD2A8S0_9LAMI|nr:unnamed protein product [Fraxinus pennsylvanica]
MLISLFHELPNSYFVAGISAASVATTDASCQSASTTYRHTLKDVNNLETSSEFLSKATSTTVYWVQMPGMKPGPNSVGIFAISQSCGGVGARVCSLVSLEPANVLCCEIHLLAEKVNFNVFRT